MHSKRNQALKITPALSAHTTELVKFEDLISKKTPIAVLGLGYVGLPLACFLARTFKVIGFDINKSRIKELHQQEDSTNEIADRKLLRQDTLTFTDQANALEDCRVIIVAVPTPVDSFNRPDLSPLVSASTTIGKVLQPGSVVVFESTVYPGVTEDVCKKTLETVSGLKCDRDFYLGYSPERINPGDKVHTIDKIIKVVSGSTPETADLLCKVYGKLTTGGIHRAPSIKVAEAAKLSENIQRDVNIALINELTVIYGSLGLSISDVLDAARTKWNFLNFYPGLVGGHCIGVDPYYLTHVAEKLKTSAFLVSTSRTVNEGMPRYLAQRAIAEVLKSSNKTDIPLTVGILGAAFKENVPDTRNTKVIALAEELEWFGCKVHIVDEHADAETFSHEYGRKLQTFESLPECHALIISVRHDSFIKNFSPKKLKTRLKAPYVVLDIKEMLQQKEAEGLGLKLIRL